MTRSDGDLQYSTVPSILEKGKRDEADVVDMSFGFAIQHRPFYFGEGEGG